MNIRWIVLVFFVAAVVACSQAAKPSSPELFAAVNRGDHDAAETLLVGGANPDSIGGGGNQAALLAAISRGDVRMVDLLLKFKATPEGLGPQGFSPLNWAASSGASTGRKVLIFRSLVKAGADINKKNFGRTPLHDLANSNVYNIPVIAEAVRLGADPAIKNDRGATAIDEAIENNLPGETVEYMKNSAQYKGKPAPKFGNTEGLCKVVSIDKESNPEGLEGLFFNHQKPCDANGLATGVNGIFTRYDGTECTGNWSNGVLRSATCRNKY